MTEMSDAPQELKLSPEEKAIYDLGVRQGRLDTDMKLDEAAKAMKRNTEALKTAAHKLQVVKDERDALLEEYAKVSWGRALQGMMQVGFHHPSRHAEPEFAKKRGSKQCKQCTEKLLPWDMLSSEVRDVKQKAVFAAVMKSRARREVEKPGTPQMTTTIHAIAGKAVPQPIAPDPILAEPEPKKTVECNHDPMFTQDGNICEKCGIKMPVDDDVPPV